MIKRLFFPEQIKGYYLFPTNMVGLHSTPETVYATVLQAQGRKLKLVGSYSQAIAKDDKISVQERTTSALQTVMATVGSYDSLAVTFPSSFVTFKELQFPFASKEKIVQIIPFEIEAQLPFPLADATFDFCITSTDAEQRKSTVIVAATQTKYLDDYIQAFTTAQLTPSAVTVDILDFYGLYQKSALFSPESQILVVVDDTLLHVAYLHQGNLKTVRTIPFNKTQNSTLPQQFFFTIQSFLQEFGAVKKIVFVTDSPVFVEQAQAQLLLPCERFNVASYLASQDIIIDPSVTLETINLISLAAALPSTFSTEFTLATKTAEEEETRNFKQHIVVMSGIAAMLLTAIITHTIIQVTTLSNAIENNKKTILKDLKDGFPGLKSTNVNEALKKAKNLLEKEEEIWFSFSAQTRQSFLQQLFELSTKIESDSLGLFLKKLTFGKDTITFEGNVRSFEALGQFEQELKATNLFVTVPQFQKVEFSESLILKAREDRT